MKNQCSDHLSQYLKTYTLMIGWGPVVNIASYCSVWEWGYVDREGRGVCVECGRSNSSGFGCATVGVVNTNVVVA